MGAAAIASDASLTPVSDADEHAGANAAPTGRPAPRSCYACNLKKVRCDKKEPCSSCTHAGKPCVYPPAGPRIRRTKKTIMSDMAARISTLEKSLAEARDGQASSRTVSVSETDNTSPSPRPRTPVRQPFNVGPKAREEILLQKGSSSQYFNETLLSRVIEEEHNIRTAVAAPQAEAPQQPASSLFNPMGILSSPSLSLDPSSFHPPQELAVKLWNMYLSNVEGWTSLKLTHVPTDEATVYAVINDPSKASYEHLALNFAIYFASAVAIDPSDTESTLGQNRESLLLQFKIGLEQSFARRDFLGCPTINCLRALAIYLSALRVHNRSTGIWILNGLAVRTAQTLGLHRDGERLGLSPFEAEIRRRLWWHLLYREGRAGEDYGLEYTTCQQLLSSDVRLPINIDDTDIYPEIQHLPDAKHGWTAMTFSLVNIDLAKTMQKLALMIASSSPSSPPSEEERVQLIREVGARIQKRLKSCNPVIPKQRLTLNCTDFILRKLDFNTKIQWIILQRDGPHTDFVTEENLIEALEILELKLLKIDATLKQFAWTNRANPQYHVAMYILLHLCVKPDGPNAERAWAAVETLAALEPQWESSTGQVSKSAVLAALKAKAVSVREKVQRKSPQDAANSGDLDLVTVPIESLADSENHSSYQSRDTGSYSVGGDNINEWPTWNTFVHGFQLDNPDVFWQ